MNEDEDYMMARAPFSVVKAVCEPAVERRFFIDHGVIHDRVTGKHVVTDGKPPFEDSLEQVLDLLNELAERSSALSSQEPR
jgi:hypothetical protein